MLSHKIVLRQRYSLSFFATSLVIALTTQPSLAFSVNPLQPVGGTQNWHNNDESGILANQSTDTMTPNTPADQSLIPSGTVSICRMGCG